MTTIYTNTVNDQNFDADYSYRGKYAITANGEGQVRVTFRGGITNGFTAQKVSIGISNGSNADCTATPVELLVAGVGGFTVAANTNVVTDWANLAGFTSSDLLVVVIDLGAGTQMAANFTPGVGTTTYFFPASDTYNVAAPGAASSSNELFGVILIETQTPAAVVSDIATFSTVGVDSIGRSRR